MMPVYRKPWWKRSTIKPVSTKKIKVLHRIGAKWTPLEERKLINRFQRDVPLETICRVHRRDIGGITSRLVKLYLIKGTDDRYVYAATGSTYITYNDIKKLKLKIETWIEKKS